MLGVEEKWLVQEENPLPKQAAQIHLVVSSDIFYICWRGEGGVCDCVRERIRFEGVTKAGMGILVPIEYEDGA